MATAFPRERYQQSMLDDKLASGAFVACKRWPLPSWVQ